MAVGLCVNTAFAQGTVQSYQFSWSGKHGQASFIMPWAALRPNTTWTTADVSSLMAVDADGLTFNFPGPLEYFSGMTDSRGWWGFDIVLTDVGHDRQLILSGAPDYASVMERTLSDQRLWSESAGFWAVSPIPEPSAGVLLWLGVIVWVLWLMRGRVREANRARARARVLTIDAKSTARICLQTRKRRKGLSLTREVELRLASAARRVYSLVNGST
jgi:hypothetical protein